MRGGGGAGGGIKGDYCDGDEDGDVGVCDCQRVQLLCLPVWVEPHDISCLLPKKREETERQREEREEEREKRGRERVSE